MDCPKCEQTELTAKIVNEIEVDCCPRCHGIWFDNNELEHLLDLSRRELRAINVGKSTSEELNAQKGDCPRDHQELLRVCSSSDATLILDTCAECNGVWLDGGELSRLVKR